MRSKQQPRPSYRWLNKSENDADAENADTLLNESRPNPLNEDSPASESTAAEEQSSISDIDDDSATQTEMQVPPRIDDAINEKQLNSTNSTNSTIDKRHHHHHPNQRQLPAIDVEHNIPLSFIHDDTNNVRNVERDTASPRCSSRNSSNGGGRCPSADSNYSDRQSSNAAGSTATSPIALPMPPILPSALLQTQSAAMAAYLGAAAVAAQQNRLLPGGLGLGLTRDSSPPFLPLRSPIRGDTSILDFSTKRKSQDFDDSSDREQHNKSNDDDEDNLMKSENDPLDLSVSRKRNNSSPSLPPPTHSRKISRTIDYKPSIASPWSSPPIGPYFASSSSTTSPSPKNHHLSAQHQSDWNGLKSKIGTPNDATEALEQMTVLSRLSGNDVGRQNSSNSSNNSNSTPSTGRHSAWQSHWLNKGADSVKDVFKCVWCKQSYPTLESLTIHMKETQHLGVNSSDFSQRGSHSHQSQPSHNTHSNQNHTANASSSSAGATSKADLHLMIKETMPLPRKLVRGQDVWLGKGAEQTRQILKCMWCGQSFRSLSDMTTHMQQTQHYTNIISQEQIISWKSSDDTKGGPSSNANNSSSNGSNAASGSMSTVNSAVLTCKVCDQAFSSLKDLSNHMVKNAHYKEHIMRSISESGGRRMKTREKRKKSLPVRKLLEIERAQNEYKNGDNPPLAKPIRDTGSSGRITCEKCGDKIDTSVFVEHIRQCIGAATDANVQRNLLKNNILVPDTMSGLRDGRKSISGEDSNTSQSSRLMSPNSAVKEGSSASDKTGTTSVLNAIEQLIEKSFDTRSRHVASNFQTTNQQSAPLGSSILKRLGIDESVDYTKPLIDSQTMNLLRGFSQQSASSTYSQRERSASESSSVSDRGSSGIDTFATPERRSDSANNGGAHEPSERTTHYDDNDDETDDNETLSTKIKPDPDGEVGSKSKRKMELIGAMKKEMADYENERDENQSDTVHESRTALSSPPLSSKRSILGDDHRTPLASPNSDAVSPRSTPDNANKKSKASMSSTNSLGALSSMFDSLTGSSSAKPIEGGRRTNSNPLAALQKLCDKTENTAAQNKANNSQNQQLAVPIQPNSASSSASGAMLAFSWACNDAIINAADSAIKCAFCDTPFSSKGAYRHHLSKVHFVKDENLIEPIIAKTQKLAASHSRRTPPSQAQSPKSVSSSTSNSGNGLASRLSKSPTPPAASIPPQSSTPQSSTSATNFDESPHSKFLKYTELAKQLSSKYV